MKKIFLAVCFFGIGGAFAQVPTVQWQKSYGGTLDDNVRAIRQTSDGGYIVAGISQSSNGDITSSHGGHDYWIVKMDSIGALQWQKSFGGTNDDDATDIRQTSDGGYIVGGLAASNDGDVTGNHGGSDYWILKLDGSGNLQWQKSFGGTGWESASSIQQTTDGGYIIAGNSNSTDGDVSGNHGDWDYWIVKINATGNIDWQKSFGGTKYDYAASIQQTTDGGYIVAGQTQSNELAGYHGSVDYLILKIDGLGNLEWQQLYGGTNADYALSVIQTIDGNYAVAGQSSSTNGDITGNNGSLDMWVMKLDVAGGIIWQHTLGGSDPDGGNSIIQTVDGGYLVAGSSNSNDSDVTGHHGANTSSDFWTVKLDNGGNLLWQKSIGGTAHDAPEAIIQCNDGGYVLAGLSASTDGDASVNKGGLDYWIVKLQSTTTGISAPDLNRECNVYPNPANEKIYCKADKPFHNASIAVTDLLGRELLSAKNQNGNNIGLNIQSLPSGIYVVNVIDNDNRYFQKIIKQ